MAYRAADRLESPTRTALDEPLAALREDSSARRATQEYANQREPLVRPKVGTHPSFRECCWPFAMNCASLEVRLPIGEPPDAQGSLLSASAD
jgi:hypothetical protein